MDTKKIGRFIAENRKVKKLTQKELAERLGVSDKTVSRWENGNYMPDLSLLQPLSEELGITLNELLSGEHIKQEHAAEKAEASLASTLEYSDRKIKKSRLKVYLTMVGCVYGVLFIWLLLNAVFLQKRHIREGTLANGRISIQIIRLLKWDSAEVDSRFLWIQQKQWDRRGSFIVMQFLICRRSTICCHYRSIPINLI